MLVDWRVSVCDTATTDAPRSISIVHPHARLSLHAPPPPSPLCLIRTTHRRRPLLISFFICLNLIAATHFLFYLLLVLLLAIPHRIKSARRIYIYQAPVPVPAARTQQYRVIPLLLLLLRSRARRYTHKSTRHTTIRIYQLEIGENVSVCVCCWANAVAPVSVRANSAIHRTLLVRNWTNKSFRIFYDYYLVYFVCSRICQNQKSIIGWLQKRTNARDSRDGEREKERKRERARSARIYYELWICIYFLSVNKYSTRHT